MKLGGEVQFRITNSISAYGMAEGTFSPTRPHRITYIVNFSPIWMKLGGEVSFMLSNSI